MKERPFNNTIKKNVSGTGNKVSIPLAAKFNECEIHIEGNNNEIEIGDCTRFNNTRFYIKGSSNKIKIHNEVVFSRGGEFWIEDTQCLIEIGEGSSFEDVHLAATENGSKIIIGKQCMFAYDIDLRTGDSHSIISTETNQRINYAKDIAIGDHVWIASHCSILKGVSIAENSVVATRSVVTKSFSAKGVIIGGSPAKIIKENINWDRARL